MKVVYFIQTHRDPEQIYRLVQTIKKSSPESFILISHNFYACNLDVTPLEALPGVEIIKRTIKGGRGDFALIQSYLDAAKWLFDHQIDFDWLINITGQDYPTQPLPKIEQFLLKTEYDGFLEYFESFSNTATFGRKEGESRYLYQYWHSGLYSSLFESSALLGKILYRLAVLINNVQPWIRFVSTFDGPMIGFRARSTPFNERFTCYGGGYFQTLSRPCVQYLLEFSQKQPDIVNYYKRTCVSSESFIQTVLLNSRLFKLCNSDKRYIDFKNGRDGRPRTLTAQDYSLFSDDWFHFARKFDLAVDSKVLDMLDERIFQTSSEAASVSEGTHTVTN